MPAKRYIQEAVSPFVPSDSPALKPLLWDSSLRQVLDESPLQRDKKIPVRNSVPGFFVLIYFLLLFYSHSIVEGGFEEMS